MYVIEWGITWGRTRVRQEDLRHRVTDTMYGHAMTLRARVGHRMRIAQFVATAIASSCFAFDAVAITKGVFADVDGSGVTNSVDIQIVLNGALSIPIAFDADIDGSGSVNSIDVQLVINAVLGIIPPDHIVTVSSDTLGGPTPLTVQFTGTATDPEGESLLFSWDFGDGNSSTAQSPQHTYPQGTPPGAYRPTLRVSDTEGRVVRATTNITITVGSADVAEFVQANLEAEVDISTPGDTLEGARLRIPQGASTTDKVFTIGDGSEAPSVPFGTTPLAELGPDGSIFNTPVVVEIPVPMRVTNPGSRVLAFDEVRGEWTDDGITDVEYIGGPNRIMRFKTTHFTFFSTADTWSIEPLPTLGGTQNFAFSVNESAQVVGFSYLFVSANNRFAFLGDTVSGSLGLGSLDKHSFAFGINDAANVQVVGYTQPDGNSINFRAFLWDATNGMQDLGNLGGTSAQARAINDSGEVVGFSTNGSGEFKAFIWDSTNGIQDIGTLGGTQASARGINNLGEVVGTSEDVGVGEQFAFIWDSVNGMSTLETFPSLSYSLAEDINESSVACGEAESILGPSRATIWSGGFATDLGTLGGDSSIAYGINDNNEVVGSSDTAGGDTHAFGWDNVLANPVMTDLNDLLSPGSGWVLNVAREINNAGDIVGWGTLNGNSTAFILQKN